MAAGGLRFGLLGSASQCLLGGLEDLTSRHCFLVDGRVASIEKPCWEPNRTKGSRDIFDQFHSRIR